MKIAHRNNVMMVFPERIDPSHTFTSSMERCR